MKVYYKGTAYTGAAVKGVRVYLPDLSPMALTTKDNYELLSSDGHTLMVDPW